MAGVVVATLSVASHSVAPGGDHVAEVTTAEPIAAGVYKAVLNLQYAGRQSTSETMCLITK